MKIILGPKDNSTQGLLRGPAGATSAIQTLTDSNGKNPVAVAVNPVTNKIYVANSASNNVTVIDGAHD